MLISDIVAAGHIHRWSVIRTHRKQTVAEHMYLVAAMADVIGKAACAVWTPDDRGKCFGTALTHDFFEIESGDWPTPFKDKNPELHRGLKEAEARFWNSRSGLPPREDIYHEFVKLADLLEATLFLEVEAVDARAKRVLGKCRSKLWDHIADLKVGYPAYNWKKVDDLISVAHVEIMQGCYGNERMEDLK